MREGIGWGTGGDGVLLCKAVFPVCYQITLILRLGSRCAH